MVFIRSGFDECQKYVKKRETVDSSPLFFILHFSFFPSLFFVMTRYIQCPYTLSLSFSDKNNKVCIFLAGGITGCPNWQDELKNKIPENPNLILINPRRKEWNDSIESKEQIEWEFKHLHLADVILFWFPKETLCPITLYELGYWSAKNITNIFIGIDEAYQRKEDIIIQSNLAGYKNKLVFSIEAFIEIIEHLTNQITVEGERVYEWQYLKRIEEWKRLSL